MFRCLIFVLFILSSCAAPELAHVFQPRYALCTTDFVITYEMPGVLSTEMIQRQPPVYELRYEDGTSEQFAGTCWIPKN